MFLSTLARTQEWVASFFFFFWDFAITSNWARGEVGLAVDSLGGDESDRMDGCGELPDSVGRRIVTSSD